MRKFGLLRILEFDEKCRFIKYLRRYYEDAAFIEGFKKTMAYQPRVIKQNRGSSGEGIWIIKLKEANYCGSFGERSCDDGEVLSLMEANDNHAEEHTVAEFIEWCINGRTEKFAIFSMQSWYPA